MRSSTLLAAVAALTSQVSAHYIFEIFTANGVAGAVYENIRENTNYNSPVVGKFIIQRKSPRRVLTHPDLASNDLRCNVGANGTGTSTVSVAAGSSVAFTADVQVYHDGPLSVYMAKAPTTAAEFDGSGDVWFKILDIGPTFTSSGATWDLLSKFLQCPLVPLYLSTKTTKSDKFTHYRNIYI